MPKFTVRKYSMRATRSIALSFVIAFSMAPATNFILASPLSPLVMASRSPNGKFLVVADLDLAPLENGGQQIRRSTYHVYQLEDFVISRDRLSTPVPFWSDSAQSWAITLDEPFGYCWPMVSNDGLSIALIAVTAPMPGQPVLMLFRRKLNEHTGELVRSFVITDLWTKQQLDPEGTGQFGDFGSTPKWFAGGSLAFSTDSRLLIYTNQWKQELQIDLKSGAILRGHNVMPPEQNETSK
jgi:hypothetical protein